MLRRLSGRRHTVVSGRDAPHGREDALLRSAHLGLVPPARRRGDRLYVDAFRPFDKAGSYGIQEWIGYAAIERIEGSFYNVMGLPIQKVYVELTRFLNE